MSEYIGLTKAEAQKRLKASGENKLDSAKKQSALKIFASQFKDIMVMVLLGATVVSVIMGEIAEAVTIIIIVLLDAIIGFLQEYRTEKTLEALSQMTAPTAVAIRDGEEVRIPASEVVVGDILKLSEGDRVAADGILMKSNGISCDESMLTGESVGVDKKTSDKVYMGTGVLRGNGYAEICAIGKDSEMGKVSQMINSVEEEKTPLQKKLAGLGKVLCAICLGVCIVVTLVGILRGNEVFEMLMCGITIAIAAIPEGLPATVTIALALAVRRMVKLNTLVHKLHSVETLGCVDVICCDKTGTLTENKMTLERVYSYGKEFNFTGVGYSTGGEMLCEGRTATRAEMSEMARCMAICNNATVKSMGEEYEVSGDPTEIALLIGAHKCGEFESARKCPKIGEIPFDSDSKRMSVTVKTGRGIVTYTKGALESVWGLCGYYMGACGVEKLSEDIRSEIFAKAEEYASSAMRVMAFSFTDADGRQVFLGLAGLSDPPKFGAKSAIKELKRAGIRAIMITGDSPATAGAVAKKVGITGRCVSKAELDEMTDRELKSALSKAGIFARVSPADKLRIVRAIKARGEIVAMTGDGVNDAPALKEADIGVAMGKNGSEVARQAGDIILTDDNITTLCNAVTQGRGVYLNIRKFVRYLISCNIGEVLVMLLSILCGLPVVMLPTQVLLVNLVTDGLPAMALGMERSEKETLDMKPRDFRKGFFSNGLMGRIFLRGILIGLATLGCFGYMLWLGCDLPTARTGALVTLILSQLVHVFECRSEVKGLFRMNPLGNKAVLWAVGASAAVTLACLYIPQLARVMETVPLSPMLMAAAIGFALAVPIMAGVGKLIGSKR